jgi:hypothetical protein
MFVSHSLKNNRGAQYPHKASSGSTFLRTAGFGDAGFAGFAGSFPSRKRFLSFFDTFSR